LVDTSRPAKPYEDGSAVKSKGELSSVACREYICQIQIKEVKDSDFMSNLDADIETHSLETFSRS
jgi:hypothetical protein